jgi:phosphate transport system substrate-binding protein
MSTAGLADRVRRRCVRFVATFALCGLIALMVGASPASAFPQMQSQGSSFAALAIGQWVGQASSLYGFNINFQVSSSVLGLDAFTQNQDDFVASDIPYSAGQATGSPSQPYQYLPDVAGALAFMYNLQGTDGQQIKNLVLNAATLGGIFSGKITDWNDPSIVKINPPSVAAVLPATPIIPVYRADASGENYLLSDYLLHQDTGPFEAYQQATSNTVGAPQATWPIPGTEPLAGYPNNSNMQAQNGSDGVANYVSALSSVGSIGYLETAYAIAHNFPVASLVNASGNAVQPTSVNDATALEDAILFADLTQNLTNVYSNPLPNAYPVSAYSYLVTPCSPSLAAPQHFSCTGPQTTSPFAPSKGAELGQFIDFMACAGQAKMALLGYSPLPPNLVQEDFNAIGRLNGGVQPPAPTAATCKNPYVDGQVPLPGEPAINTSVSNANSAAAAAAAAAKSSAAITKVAQAKSTSTTVAGTTPGAGTNGTTSSGGTATGAVSGGHRNSRVTYAGRTAKLGNQYVRFDALEHVATTVAGPSILGSVLLWGLLLAAAIVGPPAVRWFWRRRRRGLESGGTGGPDSGGGTLRDIGPHDADSLVHSGNGDGR